MYVWLLLAEMYLARAVRVEKAAKGSRYAVEGLTDDRWQPIVPASNPESQAKHEEYVKVCCE